MADSSFKIEVAVDAAGVGPGVSQATEGLKQIGEQAKTAAEEAAALTDEQQKAAEQTRLHALAVAQLKKEDEAAEIRRIKEELIAERQALQGATEELKGTSEATQQLGEKAEETGEKGNRMVEHMGSIRGSRMAAMEFFETMQGGGTTIEGVTNLLRLFILTSDGLNPVMLAVAGVTLALVGLIAKHGEHADKATEASDTAKKAIDSEADAVRDLETQATASYSVMLGQLQAQTAEMLKQVAAQKELQRAKDELQDAQMAGKIADLDDQEEKDLSGKSESEQAVIKRDYEKKRLALRQQDAVDKANQDLAAKQAAEKEAQDAITEKKDEVAAEQQRLTQAYGVVNGGADAQLTQAGVKSDAQVAADRMTELENLSQQVDVTGDTRGLTPQEKVEYENLQRSAPQLQQNEATSGKSFAGQLAVLKKQKEDAEAEEKTDLAPGIGDKLADPALLFHNQQMATEARQRADAAQAQIQAIEEYTAQMKAAQDVLKEGVPNFRKLNNEVPLLQTKLETAGDEVKASQQKLSNLQTTQHTEGSKLTAEQARAIAKEEFDKREAQRASETATLEAQLKTPNLDVAGRAALQQKIEDKRKSGDQDKLTNAIPLGLTDAEIIKLKGQESSSQLSTTYTAQAEENRAAEQQQRLLDQQTKTDSQATGREAMTEIQSLGGSHQQVEAARAAVQEMGKGQSQGSQQLIGILTQLGGSVKNMTQAQATTFSTIFDHLKSIDQELKDHMAKIQDAKNHG